MSLFKRANGEKSTTVTLLWLSWILSILFIIVSMIDIDKSIWGIGIRPVDPSIILFLLGPIGGLYGYRRHQKSKELKDTMDKLEK